MGHVVVTAQDAIGKACVFQLFQFPGGVFKLIRLVEFVYNVAGVDHVFDAQPVQQIEGRRLLGQQLTIGTAVVINRGEVHSASPRFRSISPAR